MTTPPPERPAQEHPDPLTEAMRQGSTKTMALLAQAAEVAVLAAAIRERRAARRAIEAAQEERARAAAEELRRKTDRVRWQRAFDDEWLEAATVDELATAWVAGRTHVHQDPMAHDAVERLQTTLYEREPEAMDLFQRLMHAPYQPEEAMRQAAEWFTRARDRDAIAKKTPAERTARISRGELDAGPAVVAAHDREDLRQAVAVALPDLADQIIAEKAWPALAATMASAKDQGLDPAKTLATVFAERELNTARGTAQVLQWRLERVLENPPTPARPTPSATTASTTTASKGPRTPGGTAAPSANPTNAATAGRTKQAADPVAQGDGDEVKRAIRDVGRSRRMSQNDAAEREAFVLDRWRVVHGAEEKMQGARRAARAFEREIIELDPQARAMYERLAPSAAPGVELEPAERDQAARAQRMAFASYLNEHGLTPDGTLMPATAEVPATVENKTPSPMNEEAGPETSRSESQPADSEQQDETAAPAPGQDSGRKPAAPPPEKARTVDAGEATTPPGADAAEAALASWRQGEDKPQNVKAAAVEGAEPGSGQEAEPAEPAAVAVAPAPQPSEGQGQVSADVQAQAENAARMARMASPRPVDEALAKSKTERPAVSGKVVWHRGQDLTQGRGGPRPGR